MGKDTIKSLRSRITILRVQLAAAKRQGQDRQADLIADALEADEAKLEKLLARSSKRE